MIICPNCGKENQDHYKFCLGCGARLPGGAPGAAKAPSGTVITPPVSTPGGTVVTPPSSGGGASSARPSAAPTLGVQPPAAQPPAAQPPAAQPPAAQPTTAKPAAAQPATAKPAAVDGSTGCSSCGMVNPQGFLFCGRCGNRLGPPSVAPTPVTPQPPTPKPAPVRAAPKLRAALHLLREDGSDGGTIDLEDGPIPFGRDSGAPFDQDYYLNPKHCAFTVVQDGVRVDDLSPVNGVYRKIEGRIELHHGDTFRVGQELLFYEDLPEAEALGDGTERMGSPNPGYWARISVLVDGGRPCEAVPIVEPEFIVGRERGDLTFPSDGYVSSLHCRVIGDDSGVFLEDRGSSNGTYLRVRSGSTVPFGSLLLIGQQLFHVREAE